MRTERSGAATQGVESATYRPQQGRKKAHWRIPPATRVRVRQRIRRWVAGEIQGNKAALQTR